MDHWENEQWQRLFGKAWKTLTEVKDGVGAFAAIKSTGEVMLDKNAVYLLGVKGTPEYDSFISMIEHIGKYSDANAEIKISMIEDTDEITAGIIFADEVNSTDNSDAAAEILPLYSQAQLVKHLSRDSSPSMLALICLEGTENLPADSCFSLSVLNAIICALPDNAIMAAHSDRQYWIYIPDFDGDAVEAIKRLQTVVRESPLIDESGKVIGKTHTITFSAGLASSAAMPAHRMFSANFALYDACSRGVGSISTFSDERYEQQKSEYGNIRIFSRLIDLNLFTYHFQPIVDARTGDIIAYEALMRTDASIGLNPLQILDFAQKYNRLYDIEKATLKNTLAYLSENQEYFENRKLFINAITSHILNDDDYNALCADYGELMEKVVIELTEQTEVSSEKLATIHRRISNQKMELAIDDYGTGYSNTSNLIRYNPSVVKIDRSLITHIESSQKMQKIVSNTIESLHSSGFIALGEGVETTEELQTLIHMGIDLIQGFYVSRPKPVLIREISSDLKSEFIRYNLEARGEIQKMYRPANGETIDLFSLAVNKYTDIMVSEPTLTIVGSKEQTAKVKLIIKENIDTTVTFKNVCLESYDAAALITLNSGSNLKLMCEGSNALVKGPILVPQDASLYIGGSGDLAINTELENCFAIGSFPDQSYGNITLDLVGKLDISTSGETCVAIGGGRNENSLINITGGEVNISCSGGSCLGIGCTIGKAIIKASDCSFNMNLSASKAVAVGTMEGSTEIDVKDYRFDIHGSGNMLCGIGVLNGGTASIRAKNGTINTTMNGRRITCVGTHGGKSVIETIHTKAAFYSEGATSSAIGDMEGGGNVKLTYTDVSVTFLTSNGYGLGCRDGTLEIEGGSQDVKINE